MFSLGEGLNVLLNIQLYSPAGVVDDDFCSPVELAISCTDQRVVVLPLAIKLPRSFEQLEEFADSVMFFGIRNHSYHRQRALGQRRYRLLVRPKPFLKDHQAKQDLMIVLLSGGMLFEYLAHRCRAEKLINFGTAV